VFHLRSLTIDIKDLESEAEFNQVVNKYLPGISGSTSMPISTEMLVSQGERTGQNYYRTRTTYSIIAKFATAINCMVALHSYAMTSTTSTTTGAFAKI
jgi:hypothetical protein